MTDSRPESISQEKEQATTTTTSTSTIARLSKHLKANVTSKHTDLPIIACCLVSGLCDSSVYASWQCFVSMQTGNTIFLALGASGQPSTRPYGWLKSFLSILFFMLGCFLFTQTRRIGALRRGVLFTSFFFQTACIILAASLVQSTVIESYSSYGIPQGQGEMHFDELIPLALLAFQSGGQMASSRLLGINEVPTTVLTSVYCDFISDPKLISGVKQNPKRNRRGLAVVCFLVGGIAGGWLTRTEGVGMAGALWIAAGVKFVIAVGWVIWKAGREFDV